MDVPAAAGSLLTDLLARCTFPPPGTAVACACSGGADSTALVALADAAGCVVEVHHVDHGLRRSSGVDAATARATADRFGLRFVLHELRVEPGPNQEARARAARRAVLPAGALTGHTADDQAETVLLRLLRGGAAGLGAMRPGREHPLLALRRRETRALCTALGLAVADDPTNDDPAHLRNRVRHELVPLLDQLAQRDVVPLLVRTAAQARDDHDLLDELAAALDPTDARALAAAPPPIARRAVRRWLAVDGYPPDQDAVDRVLAVARGEHVACEVAPARRVERRHQRLRVSPNDR